MRYTILLAVLLAAACVPTASTSPAPQAAAAIPQKPIVMAIAAEPRVLDSGLTSGQSSRDYSALTSAYLAYLTPSQEPRPYLARELPTLDEGSWKVLPDGRMETTYRLKPDLTWHDGVPITAADFVFARQVRADPTIGVEFAGVERRMGEAAALDDATLFIGWKESYIWAGMIHGNSFAPIARHLLEPVYQAGSEAFLNSALLRDQYVGSGPYRLERWDAGSQMLLRAHDGFAFGKPTVDQILVRFIPDGNTIAANLMSGSVDVSFGGLTFPQGQALEENAWDGTVEYWRSSVRFFEFQMRDWGNHQRAMLDLRVRRALIHAVDRASIIDGLYAGKTQALYFWMSPDDPFYPTIDLAVTRYEYDPARAARLLTEAGWSKGPDGVARNPTGDPLHVPLLNQFGAVEEQEATVVLNNWKVLGITSELTNLTPAQDRDGELRSKFAAASFNRRGIGYDQMVWLPQNLSSPENRWGGQNRNGYVNAVLGESWQKALATLDVRQREALFVEALKAMTADAVVNPTHFQPKAIVYRRGIVGPTQTWVGEAAIIWNIWDWRWT